MRVLFLVLLASFVCSGCSSQKNPLPTSYSSTSMKQIATLRDGDTAERVIKKLGSPASGEVILPWLTYYAEDKKGSFYRVTFKLRSPGKLELDDLIRKVELTTGFLDTEGSVVIWPTKKEANHTPEPTSGLRPAVAHL